MDIMERSELMKVLEQAAAQRGCEVVELDFNDDDNVFEVTIDKPSADVDIADCEFVHRAVLAAFDRNIEDYSLTVSSVGISAEEADALLREQE
jgi:ribosome maturation factor RimP